MECTEIHRDLDTLFTCDECSKLFERKIQVMIKNVYGNELIYPVCDTGAIFLRLTGKKTLDKQDINNIKELGYTIEVVAPTL